MTTLLEQRNIAKKKKPTFRQHDSHKRKSIISAWRAPKGLQNKMRRSMKGYARKVAIGFGSPKSVKHLTRSGKQLILLRSIADLDKITDKTTVAGVIAANIGKRKRKFIAEAAIKQNITLHNLDSKLFLEQLEKTMQERKQLRAEKTEQKTKVAETKQPKNLDEQLSTEQQKTSPATDEQSKNEDKKKVEKAEKDKIITRRNA